MHFKNSRKKERGETPASLSASGKLWHWEPTVSRGLEVKSKQTSNLSSLWVTLLPVVIGLSQGKPTPPDCTLDLPWPLPDFTALGFRRIVSILQLSELKSYRFGTLTRWQRWPWPSSTHESHEPVGLVVSAD